MSLVDPRELTAVEREMLNRWRKLSPRKRADLIVALPLDAAARLVDIINDTQTDSIWWLPLSERKLSNRSKRKKKEKK